MDWPMIPHHNDILEKFFAHTMNIDYFFTENDMVQKMHNGEKFFCGWTYMRLNRILLANARKTRFCVNEFKRNYGFVAR